MKKSALLLTTLIIATAFVALSGCTVNLGPSASSSPSPTAASPSPAATVTSTSQPSATLGANATIGLLTKSLKDNGDTILEPFRSSTNALGNTVLTAKFRGTTGDVMTEKVEMCKDSSAVGTRFQATINDAMARGYSGETDSSGIWNGVQSSGNVITIAKMPNNMVASMESA